MPDLFSLTEMRNLHFLCEISSFLNVGDHSVNGVQPKRNTCVRLPSVPLIGCHGDKDFDWLAPLGSTGDNALNALMLVWVCVQGVVSGRSCSNIARASTELAMSNKSLSKHVLPVDAPTSRVPTVSVSSSMTYYLECIRTVCDPYILPVLRIIRFLILLDESNILLYLNSLSMNQLFFPVYFTYIFLYIYSFFLHL